MPEDLKELGTTGLSRDRRGYITEDVNYKLRGRQGIKTFNEMGVDPTLSALQFAIEMFIRQASWSVAAASPQPNDVEAANFLRECMDDMSHSWISLVCEALSMIQFGFAPHEIVYKKRDGKESKYSDGRIGWRKIPIRAQSTIENWTFDETTGDLTGLVQRDPLKNTLVTIPIERMLLFRTTERRGNPEGRSAYRGAYVPWRDKKKVETVEMIGVERDLAGLPVILVPARLFSTTATADEKALLEKLRQIGTSVRRDEQECVLFPSDLDENKNPLYTFKLLNSGGSRQLDVDKIITRKERQILMTVLADFIMLGHEKVGSFALASDKTDAFATALGAWLDMIAEVINRYGVPRLFALNSFAVTELPRVEHGDIESADLTALGAYLTALTGTGITFTDGEAAWLKRQASIPQEVVDETAKGTKRERVR